jgi:hypothetical protein
MPGDRGLVEASVKGLLDEGYPIAGVYEQDKGYPPCRTFPAFLRSSEAWLFFFILHPMPVLAKLPFF